MRRPSLSGAVGFTQEAANRLLGAAMLTRAAVDTLVHGLPPQPVEPDTVSVGVRQVAKLLDGITVAAGLERLALSSLDERQLSILAGGIELERTLRRITARVDVDALLGGPA